MGRKDRLFPFSLQQYFGYLLPPSCFFLRLINSLKLFSEVIFRDLQNCLFGVFFSVTGELGPENSHSLFTDVCSAESRDGSHEVFCLRKSSYGF